jgi:hypothetical protein
MKVRDTLALDLIYITLTEKIRRMMDGTPYLHVNHNESIRIIKEYFPSWQYTGVAPFEEVLKWCEEHYGNNWIWNFETIYFKRDEDRAFFLSATVYGYLYEVIHYNGDDRDTELTEINLWCWEQFGARGEVYDGAGIPHRWYFQNNNFWFRDSFDLAWFRMKWA